MALDNFLNKPESFFVSHFLSQNHHQGIVVDTLEKAPDIALEHETFSRIVSAYLAYHFFHRRNAFVSTFLYSAGKGMADESRFEKRIDDAKYGVMHDPIPDARFVDMPLFRVLDIEGCVGIVLICPVP